MIYVITPEALEDWNYATDNDKYYEQLTDKEFKEICEKYDGWKIRDWDEFVREFNEDGNLAPAPSYHYIRVID